MSIFAKPLSQITSDDLQELLTEEAVENVRLEFKSEPPGKDEMLKKLSSFANVFGGYLIVGAKERSRADRRIGSLPGVDVQNGYKQRVVQWCFEGVYPPLNVEVSEPIPVPGTMEGGKVCYVVYAPESDLGPHFLNGRKGVYVRTDEFSGRFEPSLATEGEIRALLNRREAVVQRREVLVDRARERYHTFRSKPREGQAEITGAHVELSIGPRFPARHLCDHDFLLTCIRQELVGHRGTAFPSPNDIISQHESAIVLNPCLDSSFLELNIWGLLFYATDIAQNRNGEIGIHSGRFIGRLLIFVRHATKILATLNYTGAIQIEMRLKSVRDTPWLYFDSGLSFPGPASTIDDEVSIPLETVTAALNSNPDTVSLDLLRCVFYAINWPGAVNSQDRLQGLLRAGCAYNLWGT